MANLSVSYVLVDSPRTTNVAGYATLSLSRGAKLVRVVTYGSIMSWDWPLATSTKAIAGFIYDTGGNPVVGATVKLFRQTDDAVIGSTTTDATGHYAFLRDADDPFVYYCVSYTSATGPQVHGTSDRGLVPS